MRRVADAVFEVLFWVLCAVTLLAWVLAAGWLVVLALSAV